MGGRTRGWIRRGVIAALATGLVAPVALVATAVPAAALALPAGFSLVTIPTGLTDELTNMAFLPDGTDTMLVLGKCGRNFAAGMSGGVAYVYDPRQRFADLCNKAMVELGPVAPAIPAASNSADEPFKPSQRSISVENNGMGDMLAFDAERLRILIERHHLHTKSARAAEILANWDQALGSFVKVMPTDYRKALLDLASDRETAAAVAAE